MSYLIRQVEIPEYIRGQYEPIDARGAQWLSKLTTLNVFIGVNNTGKSRLLRALFGVDQLRYWPINVTDKQIQQVLDSAEGWLELIKNQIQRNILGESGKDPYLVGLIDDLSSLLQESKVEMKYGAIISKMSDFDGVLSSLSGQYSQLKNIYSSLQKDIVGKAHRASKTITEFREDKEHKRIYIPTLRGLRPLPDTEQPYQRRTVEDYFSGAHVQGSAKQTHSKGALRNASIITGLELYDEVLSYLRGNQIQRSIIRDYETYLLVLLSLKRKRSH